MKYSSVDPPVLFAREPETVGAYDAKTRFAELLAEVEGGASYVITRHGKPIARLLPMEPKPDYRRVIEEILREREGRTLGMPIKDAINEGRRR
ncbi:MAG: type II toxin-antitoxin system Phd/YefM family antitoxin [Myxococcota bacterium]